MVLALEHMLKVDPPSEESVMLNFIGCAMGVAPKSIFGCIHQSIYSKLFYSDELYLISF